MNKFMKLSVMCYKILEWVCAVTTILIMIVSIISIICMALGVI